MAARNGRCLLLLSGSSLFLVFCLTMINNQLGSPTGFREDDPGLRCASDFDQQMEVEVKQPNSIKINRDVAALTSDVKSTLEILRTTNKTSSIPDIHRVIQHQMNLLDRLLGIEEWRRNLSHDLAKKIRDRIDTLQNPENCTAASKLYCDMRNPWGMASGVHDLLWCAHNAYLTRSMLVIMSRNWHYTPNGWNVTFKELSRKCTSQVRTEQKTEWPGICDDEHRRSLTYLPSDIQDELKLLGSNPLPWWYGQLLGNVLKPSDKTDKVISRKMKEIDFRSPIVGLHIRRTDKIGTEGAFHPVPEYMAQVENYYDVMKMEGKLLDERRVFVATDDPKALAELQEKYPKYRFLYNENNAKSVENVKTRYEMEGLESAIIDVFMLSRVDYLVCSLSSGFSRLAYELMLYNKPDALDRVYSVDTEYYYAGATNSPRVALYDHVTEGDLELKKKDVVVQPYFTSLQDEAKAGKRYDGFSKALNRRTGKVGYYPLYKTRPVFLVKEITTAN